MAEDKALGRCAIICASPECSLDGLRADDYVIACDGGCAHALRNGIKPDLALGDFDSYGGELPPDVPVLRAPPEKDDTDAMLAIKLALERGYRDFLLLGAAGGRLDHELANVSAAVYIANHGGSCQLNYRGGVMHVLKDGALTLRGLKGQTVSVLAYSDVAEGVTLRGMKYPLEDHTLTNGEPLGVSNVALADECEIIVRRGTLIVLEAGWQ